MKEKNHVESLENDRKKNLEEKSDFFSFYQTKGRAIFYK